MKFVLRSLPVLAFLVIYTFAVLFFSRQSSRKVLYRSDQPKGIHYQSYDPYVLRILDGPAQWNSLGSPHSQIVSVTKEGDEDYGHFIELDITGGHTVRKTVWSADGIEVEFESGHRLFIPKAAFIGGR